MTSLQNYLRTNSVDQLINKYKIIVKKHPKYPNLLHFKYNMIDSPMGESIVQDCRGIILDRSKKWEIVAFPFRKFFNVGEGHAAKIDWASATVLEKIDGSLCYTYFYDNQWHVATSGTPDAGGKVGDHGLTFKELFWNTFKKEGFSHPPNRGNITWIFELTSPLNRIVVNHSDDNLWLLGWRDNITLVEYGPHFLPNKQEVVASKNNWARSFNLKTIDEIAASFQNIEPSKQEGYVVVDKYSNRVKIKHPGYVAIHAMKDGFSTRNAVNLVRSGESTELLSYFPEFSNTIFDIKNKYEKLIEDIESTYSSIKTLQPQKAFAYQATKYPYSSVLFSIRSGRTSSVREYLLNVHIDILIALLGS